MSAGTSWRAGGIGTFLAPQQSQRDRRLEEVVDEGRGILKESIRRHLLSDVRVGLFLSSGLDSIALLGPASRERQRSTHLRYRSPIILSTTSFEQPASSAERFRVPHHNCEVSDNTALDWIQKALDSMDQPSMDGFNSYIVSRAVREKGIVVALSGLGGDEVFGGYNLFHRVPRNYHAMTWLSTDFRNRCGLRLRGLPQYFTTRL